VVFTLASYSGLPGSDLSLETGNRCRVFLVSLNPSRQILGWCHDHFSARIFLFISVYSLYHVSGRGVRVTKITGSSSDDWIYWPFLVHLHLATHNTTGTCKPYSALTDLHTFQFTAAHAIGFPVSASRRNSSQQWLCLYSVFTIRFLATDI
jgi:hypothetical protein